jgi:N6-L-threonylcarbamoyladenine synthase
MEKTILGIETSCDETAISIVNSNKIILANEIYSQIEIHQQYNGVVPEIAARAHFEKIELLVKNALKKADLTFENIDAIAVTAGPGLIGGLIVGVMVAKGLAYVLNKPLIAVNHLEGHALTPRLTQDIEFPYLVLLISGGHCQFLAAKNVGEYKILGGTIDDALGEAFDKVAKMLNLPYPGGPILEKLALEGDHLKYKLPIPLLHRKNCDMSFSGLKTAIRTIILDLKKDREITYQDQCDIAASFQFTVGKVLEKKLSHAFTSYKKYTNQLDNFSLVVSGGVAANQYLRNIIINISAKNNFKVFFPPIKLCTDNAAMIAWAGIEKINKNHQYSDFSLEPIARWPLEDL